jgi:hypothetical protein
VVEAAFAAGQGEQRFQQASLLLAEHQQPLQGRSRRREGGGGVAERLLQQGAFQGQWGAELVGGVGDKALLGVQRRLQPAEAVLDGVAPERACAALVGAGVPVRGLLVQRPSLEDTYVSLTGEGFDVNE